MRKRNGFVFPVRIEIQFHYSAKYAYTFLALIEPASQLSPFIQNERLDVNELCFMVTQSNEKGTICDYSENFIPFLQRKFIRPNIENSELEMTMDMALPELNYPHFLAQRLQRLQSGEGICGIFNLDLRVFGEYKKPQVKKSANLIGGIPSYMKNLSEYIMSQS